MSQPTGFADKIGFIWGVADLLRGDFKAHEYGQVILPLVVLRRLECATAPNKAAVVAKAAELGDSPGAVAILRRTAGGHRFFNTSPLDLTKILADPTTAAANLRTYLAGFSIDAREVLDAYGFDEKITRLDKAGLLYQVLARFADLDLSEEAVPNDTMGYVFEELLRRFSEMSNETAGEHFTPREVIRLMVNILFVEDDEALAGTRPVRTLYDPACGTGGMLTVAQEHLRHLNPNAELKVYGQELNPETWAICRSDLMIKGQDPDQIGLGNSLTDEDAHSTRRFDYMLANPPFGVDWKKYEDAVRAQADDDEVKKRSAAADRRDVAEHRKYGAGTPRVSDGSLLFLQHMLSKLKPVDDQPNTPTIIEGGSRLAIVFSGSPLFSGSAGGGESEIRRWILENDWLEGIVALPDQLYYNTGISTYFWVLTNRKPAERRAKVVLVDARESFTKMRKSLGDKRKFLTDEQIAEVTDLYHQALELDGEDKRVKVFDREAFAFQRITVERPQRRVWHLTSEALHAFTDDKSWVTWATPPKGHDDPVGYVHQVEAEQARLREALVALTHLEPVATEKEWAAQLKGVIARVGVVVPDKLVKALNAVAAVPDETAPVVTDRKGNPVADADLRDAENVPLPAGWFDLDEQERVKVLVDSAESHLVQEIHPYSPDAWLDHSKTKVGVEIPFTRFFYEYVPPRPLAEIDAELLDTEESIRGLLRRTRTVMPAPVPLRRILKKLDRLVLSDDGVVTAYRSGLVTLRSKQRIEGYTMSDKEQGYQGVEPGDFVFHALDGFAGAVGISDSRGKCTPVYHVCSAPLGDDLRYIRWALRSAADRGYLETMAPSTRQRSVDFRNWASFGSVTIPRPPQEAQRRIADFLEAQTALLDASGRLADREVSLSLEGLRSRAASVLNLATPERPLKSLCTRITSGPRGWGELAGSTGSPFVRISNLPQDGTRLRPEDLLYVDAPPGPERERTRLRKGDVLISITASLGDVAVVDEDFVGGNVSQHVALIRLHEDAADPTWLAWVLQSPQRRDVLRSSGYGGTKVGLGLAEIGSITVPAISRDTQLAQAHELEEAWDQHTALVNLVRRREALLVERKQALITACVTGEFDVSTASDRAAKAALTGVTR